MTRLSLILVPLLVAACGEVKTASPDGGGDHSDGAASADAGNPGDPLDGTWTWWIGDDELNPDSECMVTIVDGSYEVYCPEDPYEVATDCMKTKNDTRIQGTWQSAFAGTFDQIERYEGTGCDAAGYTTVDQDIVTQDVLVMDATHSMASQAMGFLELAYGGWDFQIQDDGEPPDMLACDVSFEPAETADTVAFRVECAQPPSSPVADCTETDVLVIAGTVDASQMAGEGWDENRFEGSGCAPMYPDPVVEGTHTPMGATRH